MAASLLGAAEGQQPAEAGPFARLQRTEWVTTSRDERSVWIGQEADRMNIRYDRERRPFVYQKGGEQKGFGALRATCRDTTRDRAGGRADGDASLMVPRHPDTRDTYGPLHPLYWWFGLSGQEQKSTPVTVTASDGTQVETSLSERRTAYGHRRPEATIELPIRAALGWFESTERLELTATGEHTAIHAVFEHEPGTQAAARAALRHCTLPDL